MPTSLHDLQWAVSHNSYATAQQKVIANKHFDVGAFYDAGFRGVEFDIVQNGSSAEWSVSHGGNFDPQYKLLSSYLADLRDWSAASREDTPHEPMFVHLDCKNYEVKDAFPKQLDNYLRASLGDQPVFTPADMMREDRDLMQCAMETGWPDVDSLAGHFIFVVTGERMPKEVYAFTDPASRVCFADLSKSFPVSTTKGTRVVANSDIILMSQPLRFGHWCAGKKAFLWRVYVAETKKEFEKIAATGANMIAADARFPLPRKGYWPNPIASVFNLI